MAEENLKEAVQKTVDNAIQIHKEACPLTPVDTGRLRESGKVEINGEKITEGTKEGDIKILKSGKDFENIKNDIEIKIIYDAESPEGYKYSGIQHENLEFNHTEGQAKYLEVPFLNNIDKIKKDLQGK